MRPTFFPHQRAVLFKTLKYRGESCVFTEENFIFLYELASISMNWGYGR